MFQIILSAILVCSDPSTKGWKNIVPLHSQRADVERLLGPPSAQCKGLCKYEAPGEAIVVGYSGEPCTNRDENRWRVPPDTVISVTVNFEKRRKLSSFKLNLIKFAKAKDPELRGYTTYTSAKRGVAYSVDDHGRVYSIDWFPTTNDEKTLLCLSSR